MSLFKSRKIGVLQNTLANYGSIIVSVFTGLATVPVAIKYFGPHIYGAWIVILSIVSYLQFGDLGISLSAMTIMAKVSDRDSKRVVFRKALIFVLVSTSVLSIVIVSVLYIYTPWIRILGNLPNGDYLEVKRGVSTLILLTLPRIPLKLITSAFSSYQEVFWDRVYNTLISLSSFVTLMITVATKGNFFNFCLYSGVAPLIIGLTSTAHLFLSHHELSIRKGTSRNVTQDLPLFRLGVSFMVLQGASLVISNTDSLVIANNLSLSEVAGYTVTYKLFQTALLMVNAVTVVLWPLYAKLSGLQEWGTIQKIYRTTTYVLFVVGGLVWIGGIIFAPLIIVAWVGQSIHIGFLTVMALGGYVFLSALTGSNSSLINALNPSKMVVISGVTEAVLNLSLSLLLVHRLGVAGVAFGTFLASLLTNTWFNPVYVRWRTHQRVSVNVRPLILTAICIIVPAVSIATWIEMTRMTTVCKGGAGVGLIGICLLLAWKMCPSDFRENLRSMIREKDKFQNTSPLR